MSVQGSFIRGEAQAGSPSERSAKPTKSRPKEKRLKNRRAGCSYEPHAVLNRKLELTLEKPTGRVVVCEPASLTKRKWLILDTVCLKPEKPTGRVLFASLQASQTASGPANPHGTLKPFLLKNMVGRAGFEPATLRFLHVRLEGWVTPTTGGHLQRLRPLARLAGSEALPG
jgi:hypothetical protein